MDWSFEGISFQRRKDSEASKAAEVTAKKDRKAATLHKRKEALKAKQMRVDEKRAKAPARQQRRACIAVAAAGSAFIPDAAANAFSPGNPTGQTAPGLSAVVGIHACARASAVVGDSSAQNLQCALLSFPSKVSHLFQCHSAIQWLFSLVVIPVASQHAPLSMGKF